MACLRQIFDKPPPPTRGTLIESLSWSQIRPAEPIATSFEMFGEIQFREKPQLPSAGGAGDRKGSGDVGVPQPGSPGGRPKKEREGHPLENSEPLQLCTEGLSSESLDDHVDGKEEEGAANAGRRFRRSYSDPRPRGSNGVFPPPLTSIGASGKPWIYFKSFREDGRFVLKKISIPTQQCVQATRGNGRLVLHCRRQGGDDDHHGIEGEAGDPR